MNRSARWNITMNSLSLGAGLSLAALLLPGAVWAATLQTLDAASLPGDRVELKLGFDEPVTIPKGYTIEQPARIALDLPGVSNNLGSKNRELGMGNARSVTLVETKDRARLIVNLNTIVPYSTRVEGNNLYVLIGDSTAATAPVAVGQPKPTPAPVTNLAPSTAPVAVTTPAPRPYQAAGKALRNVDFQRGQQGEGNVVIDLAGSSVAPDIQEQGGRITLRFPDTQVPDALKVRFDVKDFATPVQFVAVTQEGRDARIVVEPSGNYDYLAYQADNRLTISVKPLTREEVDRQQADRFVYSGEKLSLNFQDIDVRSVLQLIADFTNLNLVASDTVQGSITLRLQNVPWDQALDLVLKTKGLAKRQVGNVLLVAPAEEIAARERQELESQKQIDELAPLRRELIQVNYAKAADIAKLFQSVTAGNAGVAADTRGSVTVDERTNSIIAYQTQDKLDELRRIVSQLDIPVRQVMIEARIVEANVGYEKSLGVRWGGNWANNRVGVYGKDGATTFGDSGGLLPGTDTIGNYTAQDGLAPVPFVDLGVSNSTSGIGIGLVTDNLLLDLQLSAMEATGNGEVVSQPKVVTSDKETAKILKGSQIPYQESSSSGATSVTFVEAALALEVTPQITPDDRIIMEVKVTKDAPDFSRLVQDTPTIDKNEVNAKVLVADGETIVIGGVFSNTQTKSTEKVPFLGDLPYLGRVFRRDTVQDNKSELLIFLTPRIVNGQAVTMSR
jgi:type IV pilus assembly protein PilQ